MQYDYDILMFINGLAGHLWWLDRLIANFSKYGPMIFGIYLTRLWFVGNTPEETRDNRKKALYAFFAALLALGINQIIGFMWFRNRPYVDHAVHRLVPTVSDAAFPSDHASGSFSIASSILLFARSDGGMALTVLAIVLSLSRVYVGVHYPSDILGGMVVGLVSSLVIDRNKVILEKPITLILGGWDSVEKSLFFRKKTEF
jgi:undecaprenyl-diphosphatase